MTQPQRKIVGKFTENFEYTVNGEPLSHPVWAPRKPNERWTITPNADLPMRPRRIIFAHSPSCSLTSCTR